MLRFLFRIQNHGFKLSKGKIKQANNSKQKRKKKIITKTNQIEALKKLFWNLHLWRIQDLASSKIYHPC